MIENLKADFDMTDWNMFIQSALDNTDELIYVTTDYMNVTPIFDPKTLGSLLLSYMYWCPMLSGFPDPSSLQYS